MTKTRSDGPSARRALDEEPTSDTGFLVGISTFGLGMLALLAVLAIAGELGLGGVLPFFVVPLVFLVGSALFLWRWAAAEAQAAALREAPTGDQSARRVTRGGRLHEPPGRELTSSEPSELTTGASPVAREAATAERSLPSRQARTPHRLAARQISVRRPMSASTTTRDPRGGQTNGGNGG
jgi:hypothetical protein